MSFPFFQIFKQQIMVGVPGLEPGTSSLSGTRSNQLSYTPKSRFWFSRRLPKKF